MELKTSDQFKDQAHLIGTAGQRLVNWIENATDEEIAAVRREADEATDRDLAAFYSKTSIDLFDEMFDQLGCDVSALDEDAKQVIVQGVIATYNYGNAMMSRVRQRNWEKIAPFLKMAMRIPFSTTLPAVGAIERGAELHRAIEETGGVGEFVKRNARKGKATRARKTAKRNRKAA